MLGAVRWCGAAMVVVAMLGCSPALNWRAARMDSAPLRLLLPCKPDHARRDVQMAGQTLALTMQGCDAGGATFAVSHVLVADPAQAGAVLALWKTAVLTHVHATQVQERPFVLANAWSMPESVRLQAAGRRADGTAVLLHAAWFARIDGSGVHLFHAALFAPPGMSAEAAETFFSSLTVP